MYPRRIISMHRMRFFRFYQEREAVANYHRRKFIEHETIHLCRDINWEKNKFKTDAPATALKSKQGAAAFWLISHSNKRAYSLFIALRRSIISFTMPLRGFVLGKLVFTCPN
jgi:hypothetical protein